jgi:parvulin-like peptidyl-prolyl isomerase
VKRFVLMAAVAALVVAACTGSGNETETVDDTETTETAATGTSEVETPETTTSGATETTENALGAVAATVDGSVISVARVEGLAYEPEAALSPTEFAQYLGAAVQWKVIEQAAQKEYLISPTEDEIDESAARLVENFGDGVGVEEFLEARSISEEVLRESAVQQLIQDTVRDALSDTVEQPTEDEAQEQIDSAPLQWMTVCVSHILVATEGEATAAITRVERGDDFGVVAGEISTDTGSGMDEGSLGCTAPSDYVPEFADATMSAEIGELVGPVETQFGFHVIVVESRDEPTVEGVRESLIEARVDSAVSDWYLEKLGAANVNVVSQYGTWVVQPTPHVEPPG